jgi:translation initiation factor eIF-2B subunit beta
VDLAKAGIETTVISDSAIYAVMSRVNKVILGTHAVTANGGVIAASGSQIACSAARHHSTPVVVCAPLHTLSPQYPYNTDDYNHCISPHPVFNFAHGELIENVDMPNPLYDYVAPELLSLFITNIGPYPPSSIQRIVTEHHE